MTTKLVAEEKIKFTTPTSFVVSNNMYMIYLEQNKKVLKIRHLYMNGILEQTSTYQRDIKKIIITNTNYLVLWLQDNSLQILKIEEDKEKIILVQIKAYIKKDLKDIYAKNDIVVLIKSQKVQIFNLNKGIIENSKIENLLDINSVYIDNKNIYFHLLTQNVIKMFSKNEQQNKYEQKKSYQRKQKNLLKFFVIQIKDQIFIVQIYANSIKICKEKQRTIQKYDFKGQYKQAIFVNNLITIISNDTLQYINLFMINPLIYQQNQKLQRIVHKHQIYQKNSIGAAWLLLNTEKKNLVNYFKRKATAKLQIIENLNQNTCSILYVLNNNDKSKIDIYKIDHQKIIIKQMKFNYEINKEEQVIVEEIKKIEKKEEIKQIKQIKVINQIKQIKQPNEKNQKKQKHEIRQKNQKSRSISSTHENFQNIKVQLSDKFFTSVDKLIDKKLEPVINKIMRIQEKIKSLEQRLSPNFIENLYSSSFDKQLKALFQEKLIPQLQTYFSHIFMELGKVFQHGIQYYNQKLRYQTEIQKNTFKELLYQMSKTTVDITELTKQQFVNSIKIQKYLQEYTKKKNEMLQITTKLLQKIQDHTLSYPNVIEKKRTKHKFEPDKQQQIYHRKNRDRDYT